MFLSWRATARSSTNHYKTSEKYKTLILYFDLDLKITFSVASLYLSSDLDLIFEPLLENQ